MALIDRTIYPRLPATFEEKELAEFYTPLEDEVFLAQRSVRGESSILNFLAMLKTFQKLHYFPHPVEMPLAITRHIHTCLGFSTIAPTAYPPRSLYRHQQTIRDYLQFTSFDRSARHLVVRRVYEAALTRDDPADLLNVAVAALLEARYELPAFSTLERLVKRLRQLVNNNYYRKVFGRLSQQEIARLEKLTVVSGPRRYSPFQQLKEPPGQASLTNLREWLKQLDWLEGLGSVDGWLAEIPLLKIKSLAAQASVMSVSEVSDCTPAKRYTLLICLIRQATSACRDGLVEMLVKRMAYFHKRGQQTLELVRDRQREMSEELISTLGDILEVIEPGDGGGDWTEFDPEPEEPEDDDAEDADDEAEEVAAQSQEAGEAANGAAETVNDTPQTETEAEELARLHEEARLGRQLRQLLAQHGGVETLVEACQSISAYKGNNYLPLLPRFFKSHRTLLLKLIERLQPQAATADTALASALEFVLNHRRSRARWCKDELDLSFASELWRKNVRLRKPRKRKYRLDHRMLEICVLSYVAFELKTGDMYVRGSDDYADYREQLLSWEECQPQLAEYCHSLELPASAAALVAELKTNLARRSREVDESFVENESVTINLQGQLSLKKVGPSATPGAKSEANSLLTLLHQRLPPRGLLQILAHAEHWCGFTRQFGPFSGSETKIERQAATARYILTVFAYGTGLGPVQTASHFDNELATPAAGPPEAPATTSGGAKGSGSVSTHQLSFLNRTHLSTTKLEAASTRLINAYSQFALPLVWGDPQVAVADGTKIELPDNTLFSQYHFRYGGKGGIAYHHISDTYVALFSHFITCGVWEATYIIDGLLKNKSLLQPDTLHADTQGQTTAVFGLAYLLGIRLLPRIRNLHDLVFYRADKSLHYEHIEALFTQNVDWNLIQTHWSDLMRVVLSIKAGKILPSTLLRKLGSYSRKNRLYAAFSELGRVIRTLFLLDYITDPNLRRGITASTNKVESYNSFTDWITFGGEGLLSVFDGEEREKRLKYTDLIANAIMLQNVVDLTRLLKELQSEGVNVSREAVSQLSPYLTRHIRRYGDYKLDLDNQPVPLNEAATSLHLED